MNSRLWRQDGTLGEIAREGNVHRRQDLTTFYQQFIGEGDLCFDVGANVGERADIFLAIGAFVICIEPQPTCVDKLAAKYRRNPKVVVVPKGLAAKPGTMNLLLCKEADTLATFTEKWKRGRFRDYTWESAVAVPVTTLDNLVREFGPPAFCKIDVEGFEYQVLQGLRSLIGIVSFEFTREFLDDARQCMEHLCSLGYSDFNYAIGDNLAGRAALELREWTKPSRVLEAMANQGSSLLWGDIYARPGQME